MRSKGFLALVLFSSCPRTDLDQENLGPSVLSSPVLSGQFSFEIVEALDPQIKQCLYAPKL